jgi:hypothetical protein
VCVDMEDRQARVGPREPTDDRIGNGVIAPEDDRQVPPIDHTANPCLDDPPCLVALRQRQIPVVANHSCR